MQFKTHQSFVLAGWAEVRVTLEHCVSATARSVYVILHAAALPARLAPRSEGNLTQSSTVKPQGSAGTSDHGPRASCLGLRAFSISFVGSSGISFVGVYIAMHAPIPC